MNEATERAWVLEPAAAALSTHRRRLGGVCACGHRSLTDLDRDRHVAAVVLEQVLEDTNRFDAGDALVVAPKGTRMRDLWFGAEAMVAHLARPEW
jgi:hypothetical protein